MQRSHQAIHIKQFLEALRDSDRLCKLEPFGDSDHDKGYTEDQMVHDVLRMGFVSVEVLLDHYGVEDPKDHNSKDGKGHPDT